MRKTILALAVTSICLASTAATALPISSQIVLAGVAQVNHSAILGDNIILVKGDQAGNGPGVGGQKGKKIGGHKGKQAEGKDNPNKGGDNPNKKPK